MHVRNFLKIFIILSVSLLTGCVKFVMVEMNDVSKYPAKPDIVVGSSFNTMDHSIVIQMPDSCFEGSSHAITSGDARESNVVLATHCSNWVTGVEKELIRKGFKVKSSLELAITLKQGKRTLVEAAREIGAGAVLQINMLEFPVLKSDPKLLKYYQSNRYGENLGPTQLHDFYSQRISEYVKLAIEKSGRIEAGLLDCKIIDVKTQDTVFYFTHKVKSPITDGNFLFRYDNKYSVIPVRPAIRGGHREDPASKTSSEAVLFTEQTVDPLNRQKEILAEKLSQAFVENFSTVIIPSQPSISSEPAKKRISKK